jgi:phosphatidylglycerophosphatase A
MSEILRWSRRLVLFVATGFGVGYSPIAPGTVGALWGVLIVRGLYPHMAVRWQIFLAAALVLLAIPVCDRGEKEIGIKDPHPVVADEYLTFPLCMIGLPAQQIWMLGAAFVTHRAMDIIKPWPARGLQALPGGLGIVVDDAVSSLYSLACNWLIFWMAQRFLGLGAS